MTDLDVPPLRVSFQGALGAFSELAIRQQWGDAVEVIPCATFEAALEALTAHAVDRAVIPIENAIAGRVRVALTALEAVALDVVRVGEIRVPIHLCLLAPRGATLAGLRDVHSHPVALAQCRIFFARHGWLIPAPHADTAGAACEVAERGDITIGAIAADAAAVRYGLDIIARNVEDIPANWTRFVIVQRRVGP
jgi:prephenate dehydratase